MLLTIRHHLHIAFLPVIPKDELHALLRLYRACGSRFTHSALLFLPVLN